MSHEMRTVFVSSGLTVGLNIAPPPPGPMMRKSPGRSAAALDKHTATRIAGRKRSFIGPCLSVVKSGAKWPPGDMKFSRTGTGRLSTWMTKAAGFLDGVS